MTASATEYRTCLEKARLMLLSKIIIWTSLRMLRRSCTVRATCPLKILNPSTSTSATTFPSLVDSSRSRQYGEWKAMVEQTSNILSRLLSSDAKADLLVLFHKNPGLIDTMEAIARRIGRMGSAVEAEMRDLVAMGLLKVKVIGGNMVYSLDRSGDKRILEEAADHIRIVKQ